MDDAPTQIYVPDLRRELVRLPLPGTVLFFDPGLPDTAAAAGLYHPQNYPFSREQAARVLDELLAVGQSLGAAAVADSLAFRMIQERSLLSSREKADLDHPAPFSDGQSATDENPKIAAQKVLLLVWDLEKRLLEITALRQEIVNAVKPLAENLHGTSDDGAFKELAEALPSGALPEEFAALAAIPPSMTPDWRLALSAMAVFLPPGALLVTCHDDMRHSLAEASLLQPLPEKISSARGMWPGNARSPLLRAKAPLWKILGHSREPENSPWLRAAPEIIVCPA